MKRTKYKPVAWEVLKAFGFSRIRKHNAYTKKFTHYNSRLDLYYGANIHTINDFALNYKQALAHAMAMNIQNEWANLIP